MRKNGFSIMDAIGQAIAGNPILPIPATYTTYQHSG